MEVWKCNTGKIELHFDLELESIENIVAIEDLFYVIGIENDSKTFKYVLKALGKNEVSFELRKLVLNIFITSMHLE